MSYKVHLSRSVSAKIASWQLPDFLLVEIHLRLNDELARSPSELLVPVSEPFEGMIYSFRVIDPADRLTEHICTFRVLYGQDEETLHVVNIRHVQRSG